MHYFGSTDIGKVRDTNQDSFFIDTVPDKTTGEEILLAVVCDGMGGANGGSVASKLAAETFVAEMKKGIDGIMREKLPADACESIMTYAVSCANRAVYTAAREKPSLRGMGTTLVSVLLFRGAAYVVNVGDSRLYIHTADGISQLTHDHSYVQTLVDQGKLQPADAKNHPNKNVIMRAVGTEPTVTPDYFKVLPDRKDFLLCSDGLSNFVTETDMRDALRRCESAADAVRDLIYLANERGGGDNITAVLIRV